MKYLVGMTAILTMFYGLRSPAVACNQKLADSYDQKIKTAIFSRDSTSLEKYALQQAAVYHACAAESSGHTKTRYQLGEAASWDQAAQALNNESSSNLQKKQQYAHNAIKIATPIATAGGSSDKEKKAARAILWTLGWAHAG
jgi:hypothetical protein